MKEDVRIHACKLHRQLESLRLITVISYARFMRLLISNHGVTPLQKLGYPPVVIGVRIEPKREAGAVEEIVWFRLEIDTRGAIKHPPPKSAALCR